MTKESYFEELSYALRRRGLLTRSVEEDGLLSVEWKGSSRVRKSSAVQYDPTWVVADRAKATLAQVIEVAEIVMDYMKFLNASLSLKAEGLENGYRALADFNGVVWQGRETLLGAQFITWAWDYDGKGLINELLYGRLSERQGVFSCIRIVSMGVCWRNSAQLSIPYRAILRESALSVFTLRRVLFP